MHKITYILAAIGLMSLGAALMYVLNDARGRTLSSHEVVNTESVIIDPNTRTTHADVRAAVAESRETLATLQETMPRIHDVRYQPPVVRTVPMHTWAATLGPLLGVLVFMGMVVIAALIALKWKLDAHGKQAPAECGDMLALHRQAEALTSRMEALETILLEGGPNRGGTAS